MATNNWRMEDEANRMQRRLPGTNAGGGGGTGAPAPASAPRPLAEQAGAAVRRGLTTVRDAGAAALRQQGALYGTPLKGGYESGSNFRRGLLGTSGPAAQQAQGGGGSTPTPRRRPVRGGAPMAESFDRGRQPSGGSEGVVETVGPDGVRTFTGSPGSTPSTDLGTFSGDQGAQTSGRDRGEAAPVFRGLNRDPQDLAQRTINQQTGLARRARSQVMGGLPRDEIIRRLEHSQGSAFNKGRPSARAAIAGVYADQLAAADGTSARLQEGGNRAALSGLRGATEGELAQQGAANAGVLEGQRQQGDRQLATLGSELSANAPESLVDASGNIMVRRGLSASQVTGADGQPVRAPAAPPEGQITPAVQLKALQDEMASLVDMPMEEEARAARLAQIQGQIDGLVGIQQEVGQGVPEQAIADLRKNPKLAADFDLKYGRGAAARILGQ